MAYKDEKWFEGFLGQFAKGRPKPFRKSLARAIDLGQESPESAAEAIRAFGSVRDWNPRRTERIARKLASKKPVPIAAERYESLDPIAESVYANIYGRTPTPEEKQRVIGLAGSYRINPNDPGAFNAFLTDLALASPEGQAKYKTERDIMWESMFGTMPRTAEGNLMRGLVAFRPEVSRQIADTLVG